MEQKSDLKIDYELINKLGEGGNGVVFKALNKKNKKEYAIKKIDKIKIKNYFKNTFFSDPTEEDMKPYIDTFLKEIENMKVAEGKNQENENTVKFYEYFDTNDEFDIVMELCNENLTDFISNKKNITSEDIYEILSQLNNTFRIISSKKIAHRDLKLENILIKYENENDKSNYIVKLSDYGESKKLLLTNKYTQVGTCNFTAPEILKGQNYNIECDLWSLGIIIHVLLFRNYPYQGKTFSAVKNNIDTFKNKKIEFSNKPEDKYINDLIKKLLIINPKERLTWEEYFSHPFFTDRDYNKYYEKLNRLGGGGFGEVFKAKLRRNNQLRAIKIIDKQKIRDEIKKKKFKKPNEEDMKPYIEGFYNEIKIMQIIENTKDNDNTVKFYEFFDTEKEFVIVMELCDEDLTNFLIKKGSLNYIELRDLLIQLNNSLKIMVENRYVHRDLKLENILIKYTNDKQTKYKVKLTDYGISKQLLTLTKKLSTKIGSPSFMAPEVEHGEQYNQECDLWSLGVIIHVLLFKDYPEINDDNYNIKKSNNDDLDDLLRKLLIQNPEQRLKWNDYFNHSFFTKNIINEEKKSNEIIIKLKVTENDKIKNTFNKMYFLECNYYLRNFIEIPFENENEEIKGLNNENTKIFIDNKQVEFCKYFIPNHTGVYEIKIVFKKKLTNCSYLFRNCTNIISIDLSSFDTSNVTNMNYMFGRCIYLETLNLDNFNTEKVTDMGYMFNKCKTLKLTLPPSFNTKNVKNMEFMFHACENLEEINFPSSFTTNNVIKMKAMFGKCSKLKKLDLNKFNIEKVEEISYMFDQCNNLTEILINPINFITKKAIKSLDHMFNECENLKNIDLQKFKIEDATILSDMFNKCEKLTNLNLSQLHIKGENTVCTLRMFENCINLKTLDLSSFKIKDDYKIENMFNNLPNIEKIKVNKSEIEIFKEKFKDIESKFRSE